MLLAELLMHHLIEHDCPNQTGSVKRRVLQFIKQLKAEQCPESEEHPGTRTLIPAPDR